MLVHMLGAELIFLLLPFTKLAHAVLMPFGQWITARAWKFSPEAGEEIRVTLGKEGEKV
jgi:nitrate reductase gamma subunit